ncbi:MAG TPA: SDR family NAD(P)-dependent oxidoreductase [Myxococcota bacterium]|nr:SDR family NAD(P)-dependent oxidoreductase [Myxococcota bacterium]
MKRLEGRVAVVTGAASGIGRALALELAQRGCHLALVDVDEAGLGPVADRVRALGRKVSLHRVDVSERAQMERLPGAVIAEHGHVHVLVNNAGVSVSGVLADQSLDDFAWIVGINFWGVVYGCKLFLPQLLAEDEAHIVNLSSLFGLIGVPTQVSYNATKYAVRGVSEALISELSGTRVGVTCVHPGGIRTNIVRAARASTPRDEAENERTAALFERFAMPPEKAARKIARAVSRNQARLRIGAETYLLDWLKRLAPVTTQRVAGWAWRRSLRS